MWSRLVIGAVSVLVGTFVVFGALFLAPGSPLAYLLGGRAVSPTTIVDLKAHYHLNQPFLERYWHWLEGLVHGQLGTSIIAGETVGHLIAIRAPTTLFLVVYAFALIVFTGFGVGLLSALRGGRLDSTIVLVTSVGLAIPSFVAAIVLVAAFGVGFGWFPVFGAGTGFLDRLWHLTLPAIALAISASAVVSRFTRAAVRDELVSEHVTTAIARGLSWPEIVRRHILRNAVIPITTIAGVLIATLIAGDVVVETAFQINGIGAYLVSAVSDKDFPVVQAITLIMIVAFVVLNTTVDALYFLLDPRLRRHRVEARGAT